MLERQLALSSRVVDRLPDAERFAGLIRRAADVRGVLMRREPEARRVLQAVFAEGLQFAAFDDGAAQRFQFVGTGSYGGVPLGVDDVLVITVWDNKDADQTVFVRPDGKISLPLAGEVQAGGLTVAELAEKLNAEYSKTIKSPAVTVSVREIRSRTVYFVGGIGRPGPMQLTQELTILQAVSLAGGLSPAADQETAFVLRDGNCIRVNFTALMQKGDLKQNIMLKPGDTVVIPVAPTVFVQGEVKTPDAVKFTEDLTVVKTITQAGGFTPPAAPQRVNVVRDDGLKKQTITVNVDAILRNSAKDMALQPGDIIIVPQRLF